MVLAFNVILENDPDESDLLLPNDGLLLPLWDLDRGLVPLFLDLDLDLDLTLDPDPVVRLKKLLAVISMTLS